MLFVSYDKLLLKMGAGSHVSVFGIKMIAKQSHTLINGERSQSDSLP